MARLFYSYSHRDEIFRDDLETHLATLKRSGVLETWHDRRIDAGEAWDGRIRQELEAADIILLLVSPDFLASDYCHDVEVARALERHREGSARVVPVILRHCDWKSTELGELRATPPDGRPISSFADRDEAFLAVVRDIRRLLQRTDAEGGEHDGCRTATVAPQPDRRAPSLRETPPLRLRRTYSDLDKDDFLDRAFEEVAKRFEQGLAELQTRHAEIETRFHKETSSRFRATLYVDGKQQASCLIRLGSPLSSKGIAYTEGHSSLSENSYNEVLTVDEGAEGLFLRGMFGGFSGAPRDHLTPEEAAVHLWEFFLRDLVAQTDRKRRS